MKPSLTVFTLSTLVFFTLLFTLSPQDEGPPSHFSVYSGDELNPSSPAIVDLGLSLPNPQWIRAVQTDSLQDVMALLEKGEQVDQPVDAQGLVALHIFAKRGNKEMVTLLLDHGANPHRLSLEGLSSFDYAQREGFEELANLIQERTVNSLETRKKVQVAISENLGPHPRKKVSDSVVDTLFFPYRQLKSLIR